MKFCYVDESGYGDKQLFVMVGVVVDAIRMHRTKDEWQQILTEMASLVNKPVEELKSRQFYKGNGVWRDLNGDQRTKIISLLIKWFQERKHDVVFSAIDVAKAQEIDWSGKGEICADKTDPNCWRLGALHLMLSVQKNFQKEASNKGQTVFVFDNEEQERNNLPLIALNPPEWSDTFYGCNRHPVGRKKTADSPLDHIIDVPYFADSKHVALLQLADLFAYLIRRHALLQSSYLQEDYTGEKEKMHAWVKQIGRVVLPDSARWPKSGACDCAKLFRSIAPDCLLQFPKEGKA